MYSRLSWFYTARESGNGLVTVGPAKVKACLSIFDVSFQHMQQVHL